MPAFALRTTTAFRAATRRRPDALLRLQSPPKRLGGYTQRPGEHGREGRLAGIAHGGGHLRHGQPAGDLVHRLGQAQLLAPGPEAAAQLGLEQARQGALAGAHLFGPFGQAAVVGGVGHEGIAQGLEAPVAGQGQAQGQGAGDAHLLQGQLHHQVVAGVAAALGDGLAQAAQQGRDVHHRARIQGQGCGGGGDVEGAQLHLAQHGHVMVDFRRDPHRPVGRDDPGHAGRADADGAADRVGQLGPGVAVGRNDHVRRQAADVDGHRLVGGGGPAGQGVEGSGRALLWHV
jgi:hypothetical protein